MRRDNRYGIRPDDTGDDTVTVWQFAGAILTALFIWAVVYALLWIGGAR